MFERRYPEALAELERAQHLDPLQPMIGVNIGEVYFWMHDYDKALEWYQRVLELQPTSIAAAIGVESVKMVRRQYADALDHVNRWLSMFPDDPGLIANRRICLEALKGREVARVGDNPGTPVFTAQP